MAEYCAICGARLSDNNVTGIGFECMAALKAAKTYKAKKNGMELQLWIYRAFEIRKIYLECSENVSFRSEFRKNFRESMLNAERISAKQLQIMENYIEEKKLGYKIVELSKNISLKREEIINSVNVTIDEINAARKYIRNN